ncbi:MAG: NADH-quinone oxidoreductase subunit A [Planctomycetota bacterium]|nr:MAG: NADH-quinone oxidoreductase subunit A [Planctomycetota bacterium]
MPPFLHPSILAGFVALFVAIGGGFLAVNLFVGWLVRPRAPNAEKLEVYECGEPAIGSSFVQFDLRFYVVALLFIIFDVEVALFFPWATVFGKATQLADPAFQTVRTEDAAQDAARDAGIGLTPAAAGLMRELGVANPTVPTFPGVAGGESQRDGSPRGREAAERDVSRAGSLLARIAVADMATFFAVLLVGFAYVWNRGDLDWVRAVSGERSSQQRAGQR